MKISSWVEILQDCLLTLRKCVLPIAEECAGRRTEAHNRNKSLRELEVKEKILLCIPGLHGALESTWEGPHIVKDKLSRVNYRITDLQLSS